MKINFDMPEKVFGIESSMLEVYLPVLGVLLLFIVSLNLVFVPKWGDFQNSLATVSNIDKQKSDVQAKIQYINSIDQLQLKRNSEAISEAILPQRNAYLLVGVVRKIAESYSLPYFTLSPTFSICPVHGYLSGEQMLCPKCVIEQKTEGTDFIHILRRR